MKSTILARNGKQWSMAAMAAAVPGGAVSPAVAQPRKMIIKDACRAEEVMGATIGIWELLTDLRSKKWCLRGASGASQDLCLRRWAMACRAGGGASQCMSETQRYPWRLFYLFSYDCQAGATTFAAEAQECKAQCFLGELARLHWKRYPSIQALQSEAALADIDSMALMLTDNAALLEAEHAGRKRVAKCREETHLEHVMDSCADRTIKQTAADSKHWRHDAAAETTEKVIAHGCAVASRAARRSDTARGGNAASLAARRTHRAGARKHQCLW